MKVQPQTLSRVSWQAERHGRLRGARDAMARTYPCQNSVRLVHLHQKVQALLELIRLINPFESTARKTLFSKPSGFNRSAV